MIVLSSVIRALLTNVTLPDQLVVLPQAQITHACASPTITVLIVISFFRLV